MQPGRRQPVLSRMSPTSPALSLAFRRRTWPLIDGRGVCVGDAVKLEKVVWTDVIVVVGHHMLQLFPPIEEYKVRGALIGLAPDFKIAQRLAIVFEGELARPPVTVRIALCRYHEEQASEGVAQLRKNS